MKPIYTLAALPLAAIFLGACAEPIDMAASWRGKSEQQLFSVLAGLRRFYLVQGEFGTAREIGEQLLTLAQHQQNPILLLEAYWSLSGVLFHLGEFALVHAYLDQDRISDNHLRYEFVRHIPCV